MLNCTFQAPYYLWLTDIFGLIEVFVCALLSKTALNELFEHTKNQNPSKSLIEGSQFFIIKSKTKENIDKSKKHAVWATTGINSKKLNDAFTKGKVILIFGSGDTKNFYGYGIMTSYSNDIPSNLWQVD